MNARPVRGKQTGRALPEERRRMSTSNVCDQSWFGKGPPPERPGEGALGRRRERVTAVVCDTLEVLDLLVTGCEDLQRELAAVWDLTKEPLDLASATAAAVAVHTARACLSAAHRLKLADRIRASGAYEEPPHA
jgi:hypothetical protein